MVDEGLRWFFPLFFLIVCVWCLVSVLGWWDISVASRILLIWKLDRILFCPYAYGVWYRSFLALVGCYLFLCCLMSLYPTRKLLSFLATFLVCCFTWSLCSYSSVICIHFLLLHTTCCYFKIVFGMLDLLILYMGGLWSNVYFGNVLVLVVIF